MICLLCVEIFTFGLLSWKLSRLNCTEYSQLSRNVFLHFLYISVFHFRSLVLINLRHNENFMQYNLMNSFQPHPTSLVYWWYLIQNCQKIFPIAPVSSSFDFHEICLKYEKYSKFSWIGLHYEVGSFFAT